MVWCLLAFLLLSMGGSGSVTAQEQVHRVLFVGNSYTYYNSMPQLFAAISEHRMPGHRVETKFLGGGGATLEKHWDVGMVLDALKTSTWDYVVLQGQSKFGADDLRDSQSPDTFFKYAEMFEKEKSESGAETVFFMTWSRKDQRDQQKYLSTAYTTIANKLTSKLAPVGSVWDELRDASALELYTEDGSHPAVSGSYLAAMTLSSTIFGVNSDEVPGKLFGFEILRGGALAKEKSQLSDLSREQVLLIQDGIERVMRESSK